MKSSLILKLTALLFLLLFLSSPLLATIHEIQVGNFFFSPTNTVVSPGDTVRWIWVSGFHSSTAKNDSPKLWDSGTTNLVGFEYDLVFTEADGPGPFPYNCTVHPTTMNDTITQIIPAKPTIYSFLIDEKQANACGGTGSAAKGFGVAILSPDSSDLSIYIEHDVSSVTSAHIHLGAPCVNGGVAFPFSSPTSPIHETWALTPTDLNNLINGDLYVNIHSPSFPAGEIRGQIVQEPIRIIHTLDESQAAAGSGTGSFSAGFAVCELNAPSTQLSIQVEHDVSAVVDGHIHLGAAGVNGAIQFPFSSSTSPINETWDLDTTDIVNLLSGDLYINIHTALFPAGEIRGQITREQIVVPLYIDESQANAGAGTGSSASGFSVATLSADQSSLTFYCEHDVSSSIDAHIHLGAPGVNGAIQFPFSSSTSPINETWNLSVSDVDNLLAGDLYINIHSTTFPSGEIRGQIEITELAFDFGLDESQADNCNGTGSAATGNAAMRVKPGGRELTVLLAHDVVNPVDGHIHLGFECVTGAIQFPYTSFTSPIEEFWYLSNSDIINLMQGELYTNVHSTLFPAEEIRGQIKNPTFLCGDADGSGSVDISDAVFLINFIFGGGPAPSPLDAGDADCSGSIDISDAVYLINFIFGGGPAPCATCP